MSSRGKKVPVPRIRVASNTNSTPTRRGTSTPTSASSTSKSNQSCTFTPIKGVDTSHASSVPAERSEPKLLKPLGPSVRGGSKIKVIPPEEQIQFLYMAAQQQHFINCALEDAEERVLKQSDVQLEQLSTMVQSKEKELARAQSTINILEQHTTLSKIEKELSTTLNELKVIVEQVTEVADDMAKHLTPIRNRVVCVELNEPTPEDLDQVNHLFEKAAEVAATISTEHLAEAETVATKIVAIQGDIKEQIQLMEEDGSIMSGMIQRLGQEIALADEPPLSWKSLDELEI